MHGCVEQMHIISNCLYNDGDGWIGWILEGYWMVNMLVLMGFWMGLGGCGWLLDDLGLILMDFGCLLGWCLDGF